MALEPVRYYCPCCGYDGLGCPAYECLSSPPWGDFGTPPYGQTLGMPSYEVCACCGFEFGFDDDPGASEGTSFEAYLNEWIETGANWFTPAKRPNNWELQKQIAVVQKEPVR